jgi:hypothetical protein
MSFFIGFILSIAICLSFIWCAKGSVAISFVYVSGIFLGIIHLLFWEWLVHIYEKVFVVQNGFEGQIVTKAGDPNHGQRKKNGWRDLLPWTYDLDPERVYKR